MCLYTYVCIHNIYAQDKMTGPFLIQSTLIFTISTIWNYYSSQYICIKIFNPDYILPYATYIFLESAIDHFIFQFLSCLLISLNLEFEGYSLFCRQPQWHLQICQWWRKKKEKFSYSDGQISVAGVNAECESDKEQVTVKMWLEFAQSHGQMRFF